jgi:hypothetical protein
MMRRHSSPPMMIAGRREMEKVFSPIISKARITERSSASFAVPASTMANTPMATLSSVNAVRSRYARRLVRALESVSSHTIPASVR